MATGVGLIGQAGQQGRLAAGTGAQIEPGLAGAIRRVGRGVGQGQRDQLAGLVLDERAALRHGRDGARVAARQHRAVGRPGAGAGAAAPSPAVVSSA